jgi:hypothetical protein
MGTTRQRAHRHSQRTLATAFSLALLAAVVLAGAALAAGHEGLGKSTRPGAPTAKAPRGSVTQAKPTFTWSKVSGAATHELRVYKAGKLLLKKSGITKRSWRSNRVLPKNVDLTWKVRAGSAAGVGAWSKSLKFKVVPPSATKTITAFSFEGLSPAVTGLIDESSHTIGLTVPFGTNVGALVATFSTTGAAVAIAGTRQVSGTTVVNFGNPVTYTVTAGDGTTQAYLVTVTVAPLAIGDAYGGGKVAYVLQSGDPGYMTGQTHGLIAAIADQSAEIPWSNGAPAVTGATAQALGTGFTNTNTIIAAQGASAANFAAGLARAYTGGGNSDWYLPSKDELNRLFLSRAVVGGFGSAPYWSSSEISAYNAWDQGFVTGTQYVYGKEYGARVRAVRSF